MLIEVTEAMVQAGIEAINNARQVESQVQKRESIEMSWADLLSIAYAAMEQQRRSDLLLDDSLPKFDLTQLRNSGLLT